MKTTRLQNLLSQHDEIPMLPLMEMTGDRRILIENHNGICQLGTDRICVRVRYGMVEICGQQMELAMISKQKMIIFGQIDSIVLHRRR